MNLGSRSTVSAEGVLEPLIVTIHSGGLKTLTELNLLNVIFLLHTLHG